MPLHTVADYYNPGMSMNKVETSLLSHYENQRAAYERESADFDRNFERIIRDLITALQGEASFKDPATGEALLDPLPRLIRTLLRRLEFEKSLDFKVTQTISSIGWVYDRWTENSVSEEIQKKLKEKCQPFITRLEALPKEKVSLESSLERKRATLEEERATYLKGFANLKLGFALKYALEAILREATTALSKGTEGAESIKIVCEILLDGLKRNREVDDGDPRWILKDAPHDAPFFKEKYRLLDDVIKAHLANQKEDDLLVPAAVAGAGIAAAHGAAAASGGGGTTGGATLPPPVSSVSATSVAAASASAVVPTPGLSDGAPAAVATPAPGVGRGTTGGATLPPPVSSVSATSVAAASASAVGPAPRLSGGAPAAVAAPAPGVGRGTTTAIDYSFILACATSVSAIAGGGALLALGILMLNGALIAAGVAVVAVGVGAGIGAYRMFVRKNSKNTDPPEAGITPSLV